MPQFSYDFPIAILGQLAVFDPARIDTLVAEVPVQINDIQVVTFPDGTYTITAVGEEGTFTATFVAVASSAAAIADGLAADWNADAANLNIATAVSDAVDTVTLTFLHPGFAYTITVASPASDMTNTLAQSSQGAPIPLGIGITSDDGVTARRLTTGDTAQDVWGILVRNAELVQQLNTSQPTETEFLPGDALSVLREGEMWVEPEVAVAVNDPVFVRVTATGTEVSGALSNVADGGDNVQIAGRWLTATTAADQLARVLINTP
jgi:hypothetical protein